MWSPDGKKIYINRKVGVVERDLASGRERDIYTEATGLLSPNGQYFAVRRVDPQTKSASYLLVPVAGGEPRELFRISQSELSAAGTGWGAGAWTPDSSAVIIHKNTVSQPELWFVPITGGQPRRLDIDPNIWLNGTTRAGQQGFSLSPDGRSIAFQMGKTVTEIWALENFLPKSSAKQ
jgi:Tol biopolymer transport system component